MPRWLLSHPESDCIFEVTTFRAFQLCAGDGCDDVTGLDVYEKRFNKSKEQKMTVSRRKFNVEGTNTGRITATELAKANTPKIAHTDPYHIKYRPNKLSEVIGHKEVVRSLEKMLKASSRPHTFLFTGSSGIGKTTLARILASEFQCDPANIIEVDAATTNGVDDMRSLTETMRYNGFGKQPNKMFILDECHMLSKQAWGSLLKATEEPPQHVYFVFCTTEDGKVPPTIVTRSQSFNLKSLRNDDIMDLLEFVRDNEGLGTSGGVLQLIARASGGSARQALTMLQQVSDCVDEDEAAVLLEAPMESKEVIDLCRAMVSSNLTWKTVQTTIKSLNETATAESTRIVMVNYLNACLLGAKSEKEVPRLLDMLSSFSKPCNPTDKWAGILLAIGDHVFPN